MEKLDTKAFDDALTEIKNIKDFFENTVNEMIDMLDDLNDNWEGEAGHKFDVFYEAFQAKMSIDISQISQIEENLINIRQAYLDTDIALADSIKGEE